MKAYAIYIVTNILNAKQYVGISKSLEKRWSQHLCANGSAPALHSAIKKYGKENFIFTHIASAFNFECACDIEKMLIIQHNTKAPNGYNLTDGGEGVVGKKLTDEEKVAKSIAGKLSMSKLSKEEKSKKFGSKLGIKLSNDQIEKIRLSNIGKNLGKKASEETKKKMSEAHKNRPRKPMSEETKEKIRKSLVGRKMPDAEKLKHASFLGKTHTQETKEKISASNIATKALQKAKRLAEQGVNCD